MNMNLAVTASELKFWNSKGELMKKAQMSLPSFYVWNQNLVLFQDSVIQVLHSMCDAGDSTNG